MIFEDWGCISYQQAIDKQLRLVEEVAVSPDKERVIICSHPAVVTLGRSSSDSDISGWSGDIVKVSRGGKATYHGPSQVVVYPILNLTNKNRSGFKAKDIHAYLRCLEVAIINTLKAFDIEAKAIQKEVIDKEGRKMSFTGVWVGDFKVASLGIAVKKWVTYHGAAINFSKDNAAFSGISPCGFNKEVMRSVEELSDQRIDEIEFKKSLIKNLTSSLE